MVREHTIRRISNLKRTIVELRKQKVKNNIVYQHGENPMSDKFQEIINRPEYTFKDKQAMRTMSQQIKRVVRNIK